MESGEREGMRLKVMACGGAGVESRRVGRGEVGGRNGKEGKREKCCRSGWEGWEREGGVNTGGLGVKAGMRIGRGWLSVGS